MSADSTGATNRRFTTYDRSLNTGLDYALNRHYDSQQGRFTQVDPIGMSASSLTNPQSLNMYSYVGNDPVNRTDPTGLFWGKVFGFFKKLVKVVMVALAVALIIVAIINIGNPLVSAAMIWGAFALAGLLFGAALGPSWLKQTIAVAGVAAGIHMKKPGAIWNIMNPGNGRGAGGIGAGLSGIGAITLFMQSKNSGSDTPRDSLGVVGAVAEIRCEHLRELLNREAKYGTQDAAIMSASVRGGSSLYGLNNGPGAMIVNGRPLDQDWLVTLKAGTHDQGLKAATAAYTVGKAANWIGNLGPGGKSVSGLFREMGERNAVALAGSPAPFSRIFDQRFMSKLCPGY